jgi:hypothetical protein
MADLAAIDGEPEPPIDLVLRWREVWDREADRLQTTGPNPHLVDPELDEWRTTYGRLDIPTTIIDWRPIAAGITAIALALTAHWITTHPRRTTNG